MGMKIYVASSWRNQRQPEVVRQLREGGHEVYDFRNPATGDNGFHWSEIDPEWKGWSPERYVELLNHPVAREGFNKDFLAMEWADAFVLVMPCGRSAHLELGWAAGKGKHTLILLSDGEPELMYRLASCVCTSMDQVLERVETYEGLPT